MSRRTPARRPDAALPLAALAACVLAGACPDAESPRTLAEGRYGYTASHPSPGGADSMRLSGVLVITSSDDDSIAGHFEVPELHPRFQQGGWRDGAYEILASPTYFGVLTHRLRPGPDGVVGCEGSYTWVADVGGERTVPVACSVSPEAPERPGMPATGAEDPRVRPAGGAPPGGGGDAGRIDR